MKSGPSIGNEKCVQIGRSFFQIYEWIPTHLSKRTHHLHPKEQKLIKVKAPFIDDISGLAIIKILDGSTYSTMLLKLTFTHNTTILDIVNNGTENIIFKPEVFRLLQN